MQSQAEASKTDRQCTGTSIMADHTAKVMQSNAEQRTSEMKRLLMCSKIRMDG